MIPHYRDWFDEVARDLKTQKALSDGFSAMQGGMVIGGNTDSSEMEKLVSRLVVKKGNRSAANPVWGLETIIEEIGLSFLQQDWQEDWDEEEGGNGLLLFGPVGTGKSMVAQELANRYGLSFISICSSDIYGKSLGESQK